MSHLSPQGRASAQAWDVEFIGFFWTRLFSEIHAPQGPVVDLPYIERQANAHEEAGFDRALIGFYATSPDSLIIASYAAFVTKRLSLLIAHRPGFTAPTVAARQFATLDQLTGGRVALHTISGGDDAELRQDGSFIGKDERYDRTAEYLSILRRVWTAEKPFDHQGAYYRFEQAFSQVKPLQEPSSHDRFRRFVGCRRSRLPASMPMSMRSGAKRSIKCAKPSRVSGPRPRSMAGRSASACRCAQILAETEEAAWAKAQSILERARLSYSEHDTRPEERRAWKIAARNACSSRGKRRQAR